ncbi:MULTISPECIES: glyoxalase-like domain protein [unclassified Leptolyngbya]|uniref:glyoxalase-like domain protein n=1 Tax=unclassified Leptolyngbya TaxID=2650499 RepID=UPI0016830B45|nr:MULTISPECIES: glyoxalase-like domain protein [unclassified Leptolyngbya]MBD1911214.1 glyoxalase-like domain protein [Leptolyngbya sp. FACHB-8]MBD2155461.1 glyoxalase-like domain protein [Leptolyngbya sp. FACHB-16]
MLLLSAFDLSLSSLSSVLMALPLVDGLLSTQGVMVMLLVAYAGAMWMFLTSAPKVYTVMVSDLDLARRIYEDVLDLSAADVPLHYYYNYEQTLGAASIDPTFFSTAAYGATPTRAANAPEGLWYQLRKNTQLHVVSGASMGQNDRQRHVCFDHDCMELLLMRAQTRGAQYKIRRDKPLNFLLKDWQGRIYEMAEISN